MTDNEIRDCWNFAKMIAINIGSVTLPKEDIVAIDDLINHQKAEIERLQVALDCYEETSGNKQAKAEAITKFAERLKEEAYTNNYCEEVIRAKDVDRIAKEMNGE